MSTVKEFMTVSVSLGENNINADMGKELAIDTSSPDAIATQLEDNPELYFYWGSLYETANVLYEKANMEFDMWYAPIYQEVKTELIATFGKSGLTENQVKNEIISRYAEEHLAKSTALKKADYRRRILALAKNAFDKRQDSLVNLLAYHKKRLEKN